MTQIPQTKVLSTLLPIWLGWWLAPAPLVAQGTPPPQSNPGITLKLQPRPEGFPAAYREVAPRTSPGDEEPMVLRVLSPATGAAATISSRPRLFWYQSKPSAGRLLVTLRDGKSTEKLAEIPVRADLPAGTQSLPLDGLPETFRLQPGGLYIWTITYKPTRDAQQDVVAQGELVVLKDSAAIAAEVKNLAAPKEKIFRLAAAGAWYDVLAAIQDLRDQGAEISADQQRLWEDVLKQAGLASNHANQPITTTP